MKIDPGLAKRLLNSDDGRALVAQLAKAVDELDKVSDIKVTDPVEVAVEVSARKIAADKITEILADMIAARDATGKDGAPSEFAM